MEENKQTVEGEDTSLNKAKQALKETISWAVTLLLAAIFALFFTKYVIFKAEVPTGSMKNTIMEQDRLIGWQLFSDIERGDIVIFPAKKYSGEDTYYVKRVIGLPGETVEVKGGKVYIDGQILHEDYLCEAMDERYDYGPYSVPQGCYFMMGDNRNWSADSRKWSINKYVKKEDITAKVIFRYSPSFTIFKDPVYE